jgi:hypothetical protein
MRKSLISLGSYEPLDLATPVDPYLMPALDLPGLQDGCDFARPEVTQARGNGHVEKRS